MPFVCLHLCVCMSEGERDGKRKKRGLGVGGANDNLGGGVCDRFSTCNRERERERKINVVVC